MKFLPFINEISRMKDLRPLKIHALYSMDEHFREFWWILIDEIILRIEFSDISWINFIFDNRDSFQSFLSLENLAGNIVAVDEKFVQLPYFMIRLIA